jgi:hypothetical protein
MEWKQQIKEIKEILIKLSKEEQEKIINILDIKTKLELRKLLKEVV